MRASSTARRSAGTDELYEAAWQPIISKTTWEKTRARRAAARERPIPWHPTTPHRLCPRREPNKGGDTSRSVHRRELFAGVATTSGTTIDELGSRLNCGVH